MVPLVGQAPAAAAPAGVPAAWTPLYALIGYGTGQLLEAEPDPARRQRLAALVAADLAANAGWCWLFFRGRSPGRGLAGILVLDASTSLGGARPCGATAGQRPPSRPTSPGACSATALNADI